MKNFIKLFFSKILYIYEIFKTYKKLQITWIGDFNNVLVSLLHLQNIYLFKLNVVVPAKILKKNKSEILKYKNDKIKLLSDPIIGAKNSNCIMTDVWISMGDKDKNKNNHFKNFTVNRKILIYTKEAIYTAFAKEVKRLYQKY